MKNQHQVDLAEITNLLDPAMAEALEQMVTAYMARRSGITLEQAQAKIESDPATRASFERKMMRATVRLSRAGFQLLKKQNTKPLAKPQVASHTPADPSFDINDLLSGKGAA